MIEDNGDGDSDHLQQLSLSLLMTATLIQLNDDENHLASVGKDTMLKKQGFWGY